MLQLKRIPVNLQILTSSTAVVDTNEIFTQGDASPAIFDITINDHDSEITYTDVDSATALMLLGTATYLEPFPCVIMEDKITLQLTEEILSHVGELTVMLRLTSTPNQVISTTYFKFKVQPNIFSTDVYTTREQSLVNALMNKWAISGDPSQMATAIAVDDDHIFVDDTARDAYFASNPDELADVKYISSASRLQKYDADNTLWIDVSALITGQDGQRGASAYEVAVTDGFLGDIASWLTSLKGDKGDNGADGADGTGVTILGSYNSLGELQTDHPTGSTGDGYIVAGDLCVWSGSSWQNVGQIQGPAGPAGADGADGSNGADGAAGKSAYQVAVDQGFGGNEAAWLFSLIGAKGDKGDTGDTGAQGIQGLKGDTGDTGPQGIQGLKGDTGDTGPQGPQGPAGADGQGVTILGSYASLGALQSAHPTGSTGDGYIVAGDLYVWNGASWENVGQIQGPKGDTGDQGPQGIQGIQGIQGPAGNDGAAGSNGADGKSAYTIAVEEGFVGTVGQWLTSLVGADGAQGPKGDTGDTGPQGIQGIQGPAGADGADGAGGVRGIVAINASRDLGLTDAGDLIKVDAGGNVTLTIPPQASVAWEDGTYIDIYRAGLGGVEIAAGAGVTINGHGLSIINRYAGAQLMRLAADHWAIVGAVKAYDTEPTPMITVDATRALALTDSNALLRCTNAAAITLTVPLDVTVAFEVGTEILVSMYGTGDVVFAAEGAAVINSAGGYLTINAQYEEVILKKVDTDEWLLVGALKA